MKALIGEIDESIRQGRLELARAKLASALKEKLSRNETLSLARLCRRADLPQSAIRLLKPYVHNEFPLEAPAGPTEVAEYSVSLTRIGASRHALKLLDQLPDEAEHHVDFARMAALFARWRYDQAIPYIERIIASPTASAYERQVGQVNLAAAFIFIHDRERAGPLLERLRKALANEDHAFLLTHVYQLSAQLEILRGQYPRAETFLTEGLKLARDPRSIYPLLTEKWMAVIGLAKNGPTKSELAKLQRVRDRAGDFRHWETVRDCDFFRARATSDRELFMQLYFGTPFSRYREKVRAELPRGFQIPAQYTWAPAGDSKRILDLTLAEITPDGISLKPDHFNFLLLHSLFVDFYASLSAGSLFCELFPDEIYDPDHSPNRLLQHVKRLRSYLRTRRLPLGVAKEQGEFRILFEGPIAVNVPARFFPNKVKDIYLRRIKARWPAEAFSLHEIAVHLGVSRQTMTRILNWGVEQGLVRKAGETKNARYSLLG